MNTIPTHTQFFREQNIAELSSEIAPDLARQFGGAYWLAKSVVATVKKHGLWRRRFRLPM